MVRNGMGLKDEPSSSIFTRAQLEKNVLKLVFQLIKSSYLLSLSLFRMNNYIPKKVNILLVFS